VDLNAAPPGVPQRQQRRIQVVRLILHGTVVVRRGLKIERRLSKRLQQRFAIGVGCQSLVSCRLITTTGKIGLAWSIQAAMPLLGGSSLETRKRRRNGNCSAKLALVEDTNKFNQ